MIYRTKNEAFKLLKTTFKKFWNLLVFAFSDNVRRKIFFMSLFSDTIAITCLCFGGLLMIVLAALYMPMFFVTVFILALATTLKGISQEKNLYERVEELEKKVGLK